MKTEWYGDLCCRWTEQFFEGKIKMPPELSSTVAFVRLDWLRGLDLNQRPLGYESSLQRSFNELCGQG
jgi:hypothetical protein